MHINGNLEHMLKAVSLAEKVSGKNLSLPVLNGILLEASKERFVVKATNLDIGIEILIPAKVTKEGVCAVSGSVLAQTLGAAYEGNDVVLESTKEGNIRVSVGKGKATLKTIPSDDFPTLPRPKDALEFTLESSVLVSGIKSVWYAASVSSIKPELASVYMKIAGKRVVFVATDSFRLAEKSIALRENIADLEGVLIPIRNAVDIVRALETTQNPTAVVVNNNQISFSADDIYITSRLIDGTFPDYEQIIPKEFVTEATVLKQDLISILKKATIFADKFSQVRFLTDPPKKVFAVESRSDDVGEMHDTVSAALSGEALDIGFNHRYVSDCLQSVGSDSVTLSFSGTSRPMVIRGVSDASFRYLVMPMNK